MRHKFKPKRKADSGRNGKGLGRNINFADGKNKTSDALYFRRNRNSRQCRRCQSDYMRYANENGECLDCQQHDEFVFREQAFAVSGEVAI